MDRYMAMTAFRAVAQQGGFAAAARDLNMSPPSISRLISDLEADLGVRLFNRSTRTVALTEAGQILMTRGVALIDELDALNDELRDNRQVPRGQLNISSVVAFGQERIAPAVPGFQARYPEVSVQLHISNRKVDLVQEHVDLAIRIGGVDGLDSSALKARRIFAQTIIFVATPDFLVRHKLPESPGEFHRLAVVKQVSGSWGQRTKLLNGDQTIDLNLPEQFVVNSPNAARNAILTGNCMGLLADYLVEDLIAQGRLVQVWPGWASAEQPIYAVFVHRNYMPAKIRAFVDYLGEVL